MASTPCAEGIEAIMFRTIGDRPSAWESLLPAEVLRLPEDLARVDALLDDPVFFAPFAPHFHPVLGRPSRSAECYLRLTFLKFRHRLGYESLCAEISDSISWRRFCRIPLDGAVPHPTTLMKLTRRCGEAAVAGLNEALWAKAAGQKLLRTTRVRADTTVICAKLPTRPTRGCWPRRWASWCGPRGGRNCAPPLPAPPGPR
jgi:transposase, IS5 family